MFSSKTKFIFKRNKHTADTGNMLHLLKRGKRQVAACLSLLTDGVAFYSKGDFIAGIFKFIYSTSRSTWMAEQREKKPCNAMYWKFA